MRIIYLGMPMGALALAHAGYPPVAVGLSYRAGPGVRRVRNRLGAAALLLARPDLQDEHILFALRSLEADVLLSWFWPRRIPSPALEIVNGKAFGFHPSLLPRWRGPDPYFWTIAANDARSGVTAHRLAEAYDAGPIVEQRIVELSEAYTAGSLARRLDRVSLELLVELAARLGQGEPLAGQPQQEAEATHAPFPTEAQRTIRWSRSATDIVRLVRAASPYPGALAQLDDDPVELIDAEVAAEPAPDALHVAEAWRTSKGLAVRAADGAVVLRRLRLQDTVMGPEAIARRWGR